MKIILTIALLFIHHIAFAQKFTWFGTSTVVIEDKDISIMIDPFITHPTIIDLIFKREIDTNKNIVQKWLKKAEVKNIDAVLVNHAHYDHALDLGTILKMFKAQGFGSQSSKNIALGADIPQERFTVVSFEKEEQIKNYKIKTVRGNHPPHFLGMTFMDGPIEKPFKLPGNPWEMNKGKDLMFLLKNDSGNIMFHAFASKSPFVKDYKALKARVLFLGVATRKSTLAQIKNIIKPIDPQIIIPMHYDNFLYELEENPTHFPTMNMDEWQETIKKEMPHVKVIMPEVAKWFDIDPSDKK